jgi:hypothetical protein
VVSRPPESAGRDVTTYQLYFYSAIAQVAGTLVGFVVIAFTFGQQKGSVRPGEEGHTNAMIVSGGAVLFAVVVASGILLFGNGGMGPVHASRLVLAFGSFPFAGGISYHLLWLKRLQPNTVEYQRWRIGGRWVTWVFGLFALAWVIPKGRPFNHDHLGTADLILVLAMLLVGASLGLLAFMHYKEDLKGRHARRRGLPSVTLVGNLSARLRNKARPGK